jgi:hypothetical protein
MTDDTPTTDSFPDHDLRTVTVRLADLQRKCRSVGTRNDEASEMEERLASVLSRLEPGDDGDDGPIPFAALARELYAVERFFESNGFLSVAKEVAHVERTLEGLASPAEREIRLDPRSPAATELEPDPALDDVLETEPGPARWAVPKPLAAVMVLFVVAIAVCVVIIIQHERVGDPSDGPHAATAAPTPTVAPPTVPVRKEKPVPQASTPAPGAILAGEIGNARLALADGRIDAAIDHLSKAALVDPDHPTVLSTATQLVDLLVDRADQAVESGLWEIADMTLARAERIATRYGLDTTRISDAEYRHSRMDRFRVIPPDQIEAIRAAAGKRVTIHFKDGDTRESIINGADATNLLLDEDTTVRGGAMYYVEKIPLADIDYLQVWDED